MILVRLIGGLGNQMFQYAAGRSIANRLGEQLYLDVRKFKGYKPHQFVLDRFDIRAKIASDLELRNWPLIRGLLSKFLQKIGTKTRWYTERNFFYDPTSKLIQKNSLIDGYFQSRNYFEDISDILKMEFKPKVRLSKINSNLLKQIHNSESVMVHIRRGDYVNNSRALNFHGVCSTDYYKNAISFVEKSRSNLHFYVFSNDFDWAKQLFYTKKNVTFVDGNENLPEVDLFLMSQCKHHIIANSTFSWWGAWLGNTEMQIVVAPSPWFKKSGLERDLIPSNWVLIKK